MLYTGHTMTEFRFTYTIRPYVGIQTALRTLSCVGIQTVSGMNDVSIQIENVSTPMGYMGEWQRSGRR
jgi:hypothetical protein